MPGPILGTEREYDKSRYSDSISEIQLSPSRVFGAAAHEAWLDNPLPALARMQEIQSATPTMPGSIGAMTREPMIGAVNPGFRDTRISEDDFNRTYAQLGLKWDDLMTEETASIIGSRKERELRNQDIMSRGKGGIAETIGKFGSALAASLLDPVNVALSFIPVVGEGRWAAWAAKYGTTRTRLAVGAIEGAAGAAITEPLAFAARTEEQADYTAMDSLYNVLVGTAMGSGLHAITGKIGDIYMKRVKGVDAHLRATDIAAKQMADGKTVDVTAIHAGNEMEVLQARNMPEGDARTTLDIHEMRAGVIPKHEVVRTGKRVEVIFPDEAGQFKGLRGKGKTEEEAVRDLLSSYDVAFRSQERAAAEVTRVDQLKREMGELVDERNKLRAVQNDPEAFRERMRQKGVDVEGLAEMKRQIDARAQERNTLQGKKLQKKLRLFDEETRRMQDEYKALAQLEVNRVPEEIQASMRQDMQTIEARIQAINKEMDTELVARVQETLRKQELRDSFVEYEPDDLTVEPEARTREAEGILESTEKDLADTEAEIKELATDEELSPTDKKFMDELDEDIKTADVKAKSLNSAVNCLVGKI